ncbi:MAG: hypothetical protein JNK78_03670 [Planctomycetes bacterium]|nr:hypothetical protein [Planctomycetota bacterium]
MEKTGSFHRGIAFSGALCGLAALAITYARRGEDPPPIDIPDWVSTPTHPSNDEVQIASGRIAVRAAAPPESAVAAMLPPKVVAEALTAKKQTITFSASVLMSAGIAEDIAKGVVRAAENYAHGLDAMVSLQMDNKVWRAADYFMAIWPDLGDLIRSGKVATEVRRNTAEKGKVPVYTVNGTMTNNHGNAELVFSIWADEWILRIIVKEGPDVPQPELFARLKEKK